MQRVNKIRHILSNPAFCVESHTDLDVSDCCQWKYLPKAQEAWSATRHLISTLTKGAKSQLQDYQILMETARVFYRRPRMSRAFVSVFCFCRPTTAAILSACIVSMVDQKQVMLRSLGNDIFCDGRAYSLPCITSDLHPANSERNLSSGLIVRRPDVHLPQRGRPHDPVHGLAKFLAESNSSSEAGHTIAPMGWLKPSPEVSSFSEAGHCAPTMDPSKRAPNMSFRSGAGHFTFTTG